MGLNLWQKYGTPEDYVVAPAYTHSAFRQTYQALGLPKRRVAALLRHEQPSECC